LIVYSMNHNRWCVMLGETKWDTRV